MTEMTQLDSGEWVKELSKAEFKERYKWKIECFADSMIQRDLNYIWDCSYEQLCEELEEEGYNLDWLEGINPYDYLPKTNDGGPKCLGVYYSDEIRKKTLDEQGVAHLNNFFDKE